MFRNNQDGFTLVELLVVIAIIALLGGLALTTLGSGRRQADEADARAFIVSVGAHLETYKANRRIGVYPPSSLEGFGALGSRMQNRTNMGIEALVVCLSSRTFSGDKIFEEIENRLENVDDDVSVGQMTIFAKKDLFEVLDPWDNPYAYFNAADYEDRKVRAYLAAPEDSPEYEDVTVMPWKNPKTGSFYNQGSFQLFSAGPDGEFNTDDDIGNWTSK